MIKKLRKCASADLCDESTAIDENNLLDMLKIFDETIETDDVVPSGLVHLSFFFVNEKSH